MENECWEDFYDNVAAHKMTGGECTSMLNTCLQAIHEH